MPTKVFVSYADSNWDIKYPFVTHDDPKFLAKKIEFVIKNYRNVNLNVLRIKKKLNRFLIQSQTSKYLSYCEDVLK